MDKQTVIYSYKEQYSATKKEQITDIKKNMGKSQKC